MKNNNIFMWILIVCAIIIVFLFPKISSFVNRFAVPTVGKTENEVLKEEKVVTEEILSELHFPIMRNSKYNKESYYNLSIFTNNDMSNTDKLLNGFVNLENVSIVNNTFKPTYLDLTIDSMLGKNVKYNLESFYVPFDFNTNYKGYWNYDPNRNLYVYQGGNNIANTAIEYYDLKEKIKAEYNNRDIIVYYYIGFAKVEANNYTIYSDPLMTDVIAEGVMNGINLDDVFSTIDKSSKKIYKYTFKDTICSYSEYCLYEGKWINEL